MFIAEYLYPLLEIAASILAIIFYALNKPTFLISPQNLIYIVLQTSTCAL